jgi:hypothetical protein
MTAITVPSIREAIDLLVGQHNMINRQFVLTLGESTYAERERAFLQLRQLLAVHETAEQRVIHPTARLHLVRSDEIIDARLSEERIIKEALGKLESLDIISAEFVDRLRRLHTAVLLHAAREEAEELARLRGDLDDAGLQRVRRAAVIGEAIVSDRRIPDAESPAANLMVGSFAMMLDWASDVLSTTPTS